MKKTLQEKVDDLKSIGRDPMNYRSYKLGSPAIVITDWIVCAEISPEQERFGDFSEDEIDDIHWQFDFRKRDLTLNK